MIRIARSLSAALVAVAIAAPALAQDIADLPEVSERVDRLLWCGSVIAVMADPGNGVAPAPELAERGAAMVEGAVGLLETEGAVEEQIATLVTLYADDARAIVLGSGAMRYPFEACAAM